MDEDNMDKDKKIIFFSHSSYDKKALHRLKDLLTKKIANTAEIFLSSDGQSIPLGRNWVSRLEEAMKQSRIMLVFLSPMSLQSHWIYFEAGYAYRRNIRVVPVGILGVDLERVGPPLGLLQGFNIKSEDGLNNIIALINEAFDYSHEESFTQEEYNEIFAEDQILGKGALREYASMVDEIKIGLHCDTRIAFDRIPDLFDHAGIQYQWWKEHRWIHASGLSLYHYPSEDGIEAQLDPNLTALTLGILDCIVKNLYEEQPDSYSLKVIFIPWVNCETKKHKQTARLYGTDVALGEKDDFVFGETAFTIHGSSGTSRDSRVYLEIEYHGKMLSDVPLGDLLNILFEHHVLYPGYSEYV